MRRDFPADMVRPGARIIVRSGVWKDAPHMRDYRAEWLGQVFVERASWSDDSSDVCWTTASGPVRVACPHYVWLRFWLSADGRVIDKYFDSTGKVVGWYVPVTSDHQQNGSHLMAEVLYLGLWIDAENHITVMGEREFELAKERGDLTPVQVEQVEYGIRQLTASVSAGRLPPGMIRNFAIVMDREA